MKTVDIQREVLTADGHVRRDVLKGIEHLLVYFTGQERAAHVEVYGMDGSQTTYTVASIQHDDGGECPDPAGCDGGERSAMLDHAAEDAARA